jgi:hypothetical protein
VCVFASLQNKNYKVVRIICLPYASGNIVPVRKLLDLKSRGQHFQTPPCKNRSVPLLQHCVPVHSRFEAPILLQELFSPRPLLLLLLPLVITFFYLHCHSLSPSTTNERTSEKTNERSVILPFSRHVHLLLTITTFCFLHRPSISCH